MIDKSCILIVRDSLGKLVETAQKCIEAGVDENKIYATIDTADVSRLLGSKAISVVIIDSELYNLDTASILKNYSQEQNIQTLLFTDSKSKRTIRMIMDSNLKYLNTNISSGDLSSVFYSILQPELKKVAHF